MFMDKRADINGASVASLRDTFTCYLKIKPHMFMLLVLDLNRNRKFRVQGVDSRSDIQFQEFPLKIKVFENSVFFH